mmetsp:Transcript_95250/g.284429  ORF Transcript_95250/g.284429 Transcript_95250/m.284429 type:complete len:87 (-) Transcript_95250:138-398(-)
MIRSLFLISLLGHAEAVRDMSAAMLADAMATDSDAHASVDMQEGSVVNALMASDISSQRIRDAAFPSAEERLRGQGAFKGTVLRGR